MNLPQIIKKSGVCLLILIFISDILCLYTKNFNIIIKMYYYRKYYLIVYHTSLQLQLSQDYDWTFYFFNASMNTIVTLLLTMLLELRNTRIIIKYYSNHFSSYSASTGWSNQDN